MHHYKKYLAIAGLGVVMTAVGLSLYKHAKKEEKHSWWKCC